MSNFAFLHPHWTGFLEDAREAERMAMRAPRTAAFYARRTLELGVRWVHDNDPEVRRPYDDNLKALIHASSFRNLLPHGLWDHIRYIWRLGNQAVHETRKITSQESVEGVRSLHNFLSWLATAYTEGGATVPGFDPALIPDPAKIKELRLSKAAETQHQIQLLEARLKEKDEANAAVEAQVAQSAETIAALKAEVQRIKAENEGKVKGLTFSEAENPSHLIDPLLRESGWNPDGANVREFEVDGMPSETGKGYADYVLWGSDGLPLAVVEAKKTQVSPETGKHQAKLYADRLEARYGRRPFIYYTNGYRSWFWDDHDYPPRPVLGFHSRDELQLIVNRRTDRKDITRARPNPAIVERTYQQIAIASVAERFAVDKGRGTLLAMATGTGKTRTTIALVELLMKQNWVRRVLFLADRRALLLQAEREFKKHLPDVSRGSLLDGEVPDERRILFSTYPTMMNAIDQWREDGTRRFGPGHFDLLVVDEAHRSVYQKYRAIFEYFDALMVGLTATPKDEVDRNTYELFGLEPGIPTHAYELETAVDQGFLVPPKAFSVPMKFLRDGIKYEDLSEEEKREYEEKFGTGEEDLPEEIDSAALNAWLFNASTVDKVLEDLMQNGVKVDGGGKLGKTIIFAKNHRHAEFIVQRFDHGYPHLKGHFCQLIDNQVRYAQDLIDNFSVSRQEPTIAVSVDMLDTGIDVPEVVNLVFFKLVRSKTKFWQMIGRGTRLCPDLFGPGQHKKEFYVFDYCQNLEYFSANPNGVEGKAPVSVREATIKVRLDLINETAENPALAEVRKQLIDSAYGQIQALNKESFVVRPNEEVIAPFRVREKWDNLTDEDQAVVKGVIARIPCQEDEDQEIRRFDLLMHRLELSILRKTPDQVGLIRKVKDLAQNLAEKGSIPAVADQMDLLLEICTDAYWKDITLPALESARHRLRHLVRFAERSAREIVYTVVLEDEIGDAVVHALVGQDPTLAEYRDRLRKCLKSHLDHASVVKVRNNEKLSTADVESIEALLFGDGGVPPAKLDEVIGQEGPLPRFVRKVVGLSAEAAKQAFVEIYGSDLNARQMLFMDQLVDYLVSNGVMESGDLFQPPFTRIHDQSVDGLLPEYAGKIVKIIEQINANAEAR